MVIASRRISYILPSPVETPPLLQLPPLGQSRQGQTVPTLVPKSDANGLKSKNPFLSSPTPPESTEQQQQKHPRHCLGVTSLVLDTSTVLQNHQSPGGILYSGGRDGLVASWELNVPHKKRRGKRYELPPGRAAKVRWERIGDGAELWDEEDEAEFGEDIDGNSSDEDSQGWVGVDGEESRRRKGEVAYEDRWEVDQEILQQQKPVTMFRQSAQTHTDWVNDMILCNLNQTVVTASSDRTIRAWNPHASDESAFAPTMVGRHRDYVKALTWARHPSLLFSGALDRMLSVWDISGQSNGTPIFSIDLGKIADYDGVGSDGERGSVYALGVDPAGKVLAAGTPERVVRLWDPRAGDQSIGKLVGHNDCVRSIVLSEDGRYMLTGSSDATVKLWSLAAHRCLHTFDHHESSVWALHSNHPNLERFYSGSRDGYLCVTDVEQCTDISDGECVVLSREGDRALEGGNSRESRSGDEGIRSIVSMDDGYVWTATGSADIKRWKDVGRRIERMDFDGTSYNHVDRTAAATGLLEPAFQPIPITDGGLRNKRLSLDGGHSPSEQQGLLFRTDSRDSRAVAFAPEPSRPNGAGQQDSPLRDANASPRDRLSPSDATLPRKNMSAVSIPTSVMTDLSGEMDDTDEDNNMNGIPYASLVCLGMPESPYSFGFDRNDDTMDRRNSGTSGPQGVLRTGTGNEVEPGQSPSRHVSIQLDRENSAQNIHARPRHHQSQARMDFEERELCSDAVPLRPTPDEIIAGRPGLVRSLMLNDRQHVISVDTEGEVAVWNIIRGICVGKFSSADVADALDLERDITAQTAVRKHSNEVLEMVKERVEGETMVITWCQVDTKIGSLVVHLEEGRVFDAEVYIDDLMVKGMESARDDARVNLGKWVLANLFRGLIKAEEQTLHEQQSAQSTTAGNKPPSITRSPAPRTISIERPNQSPPHRQRAMSGTFTENNTVSLNIPGLVSPAARTAMLPDIESPLTRTISIPLSTSMSGSGSYQPFAGLSTSMRSGGGGLSAIPQSPASASLTAASPGDILSRGDYFSPKRKADPSPDRSQPATTPGERPAASLGQTPGGSFMGKLKGFGKKKTAETPVSPVVEAPAPPPEDTGPKFTERETEQLNILDIVRAHAFNPPPPWEAPPLDFPPNTSLLISEEAKDAGAWVVTYRSQVSSTERDLEALEMNSPLWLLDYLFTSRSKQKDPVKLTFILEPAPGSGLKEMPEGTTRLSASRVLRARKIMAFIYDKLELGHRGRSGSVVSINSRITPQGQGQGQVQPPNQITAQLGISPPSESPFRMDMGQESEFNPEDVIELSCAMQSVDPKITLATLKHYYGSGGDMLLHYKLKEGVTVR